VDDEKGGDTCAGYKRMRTLGLFRSLSLYPFVKKAKQSKAKDKNQAGACNRTKTYTFSPSSHRGPPAGRALGKQDRHNHSLLPHTAGRPRGRRLTSKTDTTTQATVVSTSFQNSGEPKGASAHGRRGRWLLPPSGPAR